MDKNKKYFEAQEKIVADNYMSANGKATELLDVTYKGEKYDLFTKQYFIGIGVGMVLAYFVIPFVISKFSELED